MRIKGGLPISMLRAPHEVPCEEGDELVLRFEKTSLGYIDRLRIKDQSRFVVAAELEAIDGFPSRGGDQRARYCTTGHRQHFDMA